MLEKEVSIWVFVYFLDYRIFLFPYDISLTWPIKLQPVLLRNFVVVAVGLKCTVTRHVHRFTDTPVICREVENCRHLLECTLRLGTAEQFIFKEHAQSKMYGFVSLMTFLTPLLSYSKLKGSVNTKGCVSVTREKRQSNKKIIKVTTCEKWKRFPLSFLNLWA